MAHPPPDQARTQTRTDTSQPTAVAAGDPFAWWEDKQVAVMVKGDLVRGWVLTARHVDYPGTATSVGQMTIVLLICDPAVAAAYPDTVVTGVLDDGGHGRPRNVRGMWDEADLCDVHTPASQTEHGNVAVSGMSAPPASRPGHPNAD